VSADVTADSRHSHPRAAGHPPGQICTARKKPCFAKLFRQEEELRIWQLGILIREQSSR